MLYLLIRDRKPVTSVAFCKSNFFKAQTCLVGEPFLFDSLVQPRAALASPCKAKASTYLAQTGAVWSTACFDKACQDLWLLQVSLC